MMARGQASTRSRALIERAPELAQIDRTLRDAKAGAGQVLFVSGPPGIGKTALLAAAKERALRRGMIALAARGDELERHFPYGVVRQLFEPIVRNAAAPARRRLLAGAAKLAAPLVTSDGELPRAGLDDTAFGLVHGLYWIVINASERAPLLIAVDDLQWIDEPSVRFLQHLARRLEGVRVALLISARTDDPDPEQALADQFGERSHVRRLRPGALSEEGVRRLLTAGLGVATDETFASASREVTGGVPLFVHELVSALVADRIQPTARQARRLKDIGPRTVARAMLVRLGRTSKNSVALARAVAVLGSQATLPRAARIAELDEEAALAALDPLVAARLLAAGESLTFDHPTMRRTVYDELGPGARSRLHHAAARLLAAEGAELDAVAAQLLASEPVGSQEVISELRRAAALALARGAPEDAVAYLSRALAEGCERELRAALEFELGTAAKLAGQRSTLRHFEEAQRLAEDPLLRGNATLEVATTLGLTGSWDRAFAQVSRALAELDDRDPELAVRLQCLRAGLAGSDPRLVGELDSRLAELEALATGDSSAERSLALLLGAVHAWRGSDARKAAALVEHGFADGPAVSAGVEPWAVGQGLAALIVIDRNDRAGELAGRLLEETRALGSASGFILGTAYRGFVAARRGELSAAEEALREAMEPSRQARVAFVLFFQLWFAMDVVLERPQAGDLAAFVQDLELGPLADVHSGAMLLDVRGRIRLQNGDRSGAIDDLRRTGQILEALRMNNPNASSWRSALALALAGKEPREAVRLATAELEEARSAGLARPVGIALRSLGLLEGKAKARRRLEEAVRVLHRCPARLELARALVELGSALRRGGERAAAREPLRAGLDIAVAGGAERLAERARTELAASGGRPRRLRTSGRDALTPSELRVAQMAADGHTNSEVAQALFVTPKTVDTHLSHAYAKLGISSRRQLAEALGE